MYYLIWQFTACMCIATFDSPTHYKNGQLAISYTVIIQLTKIGSNSTSDKQPSSYSHFDFQPLASQSITSLRVIVKPCLSYLLASCFTIRKQRAIPVEKLNKYWLTQTITYMVMMSFVDIYIYFTASYTAFLQLTHHNKGNMFPDMIINKLICRIYNGQQ